MQASENTGLDVWPKRRAGRDDRPAGHTARSLGLSPPPRGVGRLARRISVGLCGAAVTLAWLWIAAPPL